MSTNDKLVTAKALLDEAASDIDTALQGQRGRARGRLMHERWMLQQMRGSAKNYFSQSGQDWFIDQALLEKRRDGVFVDVGGYDGVAGSNTLFFEMFRGWSGLLVEAVPSLAEKAASVRRCPCVAAVLSGDGSPAEFLRIEAGYMQMSGRLDTYDNSLLDRVCAHPEHRADREIVATRRLADVLVEQGIDKINYLSMDVEGAEHDILRSFPFDQISVDVLSAENTSHHSDFYELMSQNGFKLVEFLGVDEIYCQAAMLRNQS